MQTAQAGRDKDLRAYPDLPETANTEAWLVTIAHRKAIDLLRARKRQPVPVEEVPERPARLGVPGAHDSGLWQAVRELPGKQRQAVAYHYVAGLPYAEVARSSAAPPQRRAGRPRTASRTCARVTRAEPHHEPPH